MRTEMRIERMRPLIIGHAMDNLTGLVEIDCAAWMTAYPELTRYTLAVAPPEGEPYFTPAGMEGTILRWIVRREDTAMAGEGSYQIIGTGENGEQKSTDFYPLYIYGNMPGLDGASETPPEAALAWVSKVLDAADRAEEAAERAEGAAAGSVPVATLDKAGVVKPGEGLEVEKDGTLNVVGGGGGQPGKDGGYYVPNVSEEGSLTWRASKEDMPAVPPANIKGPKGDPGEPGGKGEPGEPGEPGSPGAAGKTAYEYAKEGGYSGTEDDFAAKLAKEIPDAYTLPTASETVKGGVKVGKGLAMEGESLNAEVEKADIDKLSEGKADKLNMPVHIDTITIEEAVDRITVTIEPDGTRYSFRKMVVRVKSPPLETLGNWILYPFTSGIYTNGVTIPSFPHKTNTYYGQFVCDVYDGFLNAYAFKGGHDTMFNTFQTTKMVAIDRPMNQMEIRASTTGIPVGTTIEIWGIRA